MLDNDHVLMPNRKRRSPRRFLIGETNAGRKLTVVVERTRDAGSWRPVTAWNSRADEIATFNRVFGRQQ